MGKTWRWFHTLGIVLLVVEIAMIGWFSSPDFRLGSWLINLVLLGRFIFPAGHGITGLGRGWLIDDRYMLSLSRLQLVLWTVVIISAFFTVALGNLVLKEDDPKNPLDIDVPTEIWLVFGISATSLVASPLIRSNIKRKPPDPEEKQRTLQMLTKEKGEKAHTEITNQGQVIVNRRPEDAEVSDLFKGEETGNAALLDLGKIQMFFLPC